MNNLIKYYPSLDDINFNTKILEKKEFNKYIVNNYINNNINDLCSNDNFITRPIQRMLQSYLSPNTPYNGLLLYHTTGSGKTCTSILIAEQFTDYILSKNASIYLIGSPLLLDNFSKTIFNINKELNTYNKNTSSQCTSYIYTRIYEQYLKETNNNIEKTNRLMDKYKNIKYKSYGYTSLTNSIKKKNSDSFIEPEYIKQRFSNCVFIIDEAHSYKKDSPDYIAFEYILTHSEHTKLLLLTATPMFDTSTQIIDLLNLLLTNDKRPKLQYNDLFEIDNLSDNRKLINIDLFIKSTTGYVSYLNGSNPISFPIQLYPNNSIYVSLNNNILEISENNTGYNIFPCEMEPFQYNISSTIITHDLVYAIQSNLIVFPNEQFGDTGFNLCFKYNKDSDKYKYSNFENFLQYDKIKNYSIKLYLLLGELKNSIGKIFIFAQYIKPGISLIAMLLEEFGYNRKVYLNGKFIISNLLKNNPPNSPCYIMITSNTLNASKYIEEFNHIDNINGNNIKIIIGSKVLEQGISFTGIREIHILEPWWNYSRIEQIIGRGSRDCSHLNLPPQKRNITIYNYISTYKNIITNDLKQLTLTLNKNINIKLISRLLKRNAIDCFISKNININKDYPDIEIITSKNINTTISPNDINYSLECDYDICEFKCIGQDNIDIIDTDTFNIFNDTISNINISKIYIKKLFELKLFYTFEQINDIIILQDKYISSNSIYIALSEILNYKEIIRDKFNRDGYIINKNQYFIYQPNEILDESIPLYLRKYPLKNRLAAIKNLIKYNNIVSPIETLTSIHTPDIYYREIIINSLLHNNLLSNINNKTIQNMTTFDILYLYINQLSNSDDLFNIILNSINNNNRFSLNLVSNFNNKLFNIHFEIYKLFYTLELVHIELKIIILQYLVIKSILHKKFNSIDNFLLHYNKDILIKNNNDIIGFIIYKHNPDYINQYNNNQDAYTELPSIYIYYNNIWYSNLSIIDISYIHIDIKLIIHNLTIKYNSSILKIKHNIITNNQILGLIGKLQNIDTNVFKIIQFVSNNIIKKKQKLTNITISTIKDLQFINILHILQAIISNIKLIMHKKNIFYNIADIEQELHFLLTNDLTKKKYMISLILYLLMDLHINKFDNQTWIISSHQAAILKRSSLFNISRTDKQNISLSIHKGLSLNDSN